MDPWLPIIWSVVWAFVIIAVLAIVAWVVIAKLAARAFRASAEEIDARFDHFK